MYVNGCDCSIVFETSQWEIDVPSSEETIREDILLLQEESAIEGDGICKVLRKNNGVTGCVVTPLTLSTVSILFYLAFGFADSPVFVSGTRNLYQYHLHLLPMKQSDGFNVIQQRGSERKLFADCKICSFELRVEREQAIKLKLDIFGDKPSAAYLDDDFVERKIEERFHGDSVVYLIQDTSTGSVPREYKNIYGVTIQCKKESGIKTELSIRHILEYEKTLPEHIDEMLITARLLRDKYEEKQYGTFSIQLHDMVLISDETNIESADAVMGQLRYAVNGSVSAEVYTSGEIEL